MIYLTYFKVFILNFEFLVVYGCNFLCSCWKCIDIYIFSHIYVKWICVKSTEYRYAVFILIYKYLNLYQRDVQMFMEFNNKNNALLKLIFYLTLSTQLFNTLITHNFFKNALLTTISRMIINYYIYYSFPLLLLHYL